MSSQERRRILIVCQHFWPENFRVNDIADYLANEKDCDIEVLCGLPNYPKGKLFDGYSFFKNRHQVHNSIKINRVLEIPRGNNSNLRIFLNYVSFPFFGLFHIPRLLTKKYDHVLLYQLSPVMMSLPGIIIGKIKKIPTTMYVLDLWPENLYSVIDVKNKFIRKIAFSVSNWHYKNTDRIVALSETMKNRLVSATGKLDSEVLVLPQAAEKVYEKDIVDTSLVKEFANNFIVLYTGNISPAQSFETIIASAQEITSTGITDIRWVIVGDGMSKNDMQLKVDQLGLENYFSFRGQVPIEKVPAYTNIADVLIGTLTKSELLEATIPSKVMTYLASGKPIVLAMDGEAQDLINIKVQCGYAGPAGDSVALTKNIKKVYSLNKNERVKLGERARQYHLKHFERNILLSKLSEFIFTSDKV